MIWLHEDATMLLIDMCCTTLARCKTTRGRSPGTGLANKSECLRHDDNDNDNDYDNDYNLMDTILLTERATRIQYHHLCIHTPVKWYQLLCSCVYIVDMSALC